MSLELRQAVAADAAAVAAIHAEAVLAGGATFRTAPRPVGDVRESIEMASAFIVAESAGEVIAWASAGPYEAGNPFYDGVAECAVYVDSAARGRGAGRAVLDALVAAAAGAGIFKLVAKVFDTNRASLRLFDASGFTVVGKHHRHGKVRGEWKDVVVLERPTGAEAPENQPL